MYPAGWYPNQHDPPEILRYWDGSAWSQSTMPSAQHGASGPAGAAAPAEQVVRQQPQVTKLTAGGYDLIAPPEAATSPRSIDQVLERSAPRVQQSKTRQLQGSRFDRLISSGAILMVLGLVLGIAGHNIVTLFDTPTEIQGRVTDPRESQGRRGRVNISFTATTAVGEFHGKAGSRVPGEARRMLSGSVTIGYSERTGGLIYIEETNTDRRVLGQFLWPALALVSLVVAMVRIRYEFVTFRGVFAGVFFPIYFVAGPIVGWLAVGVLNTVLNTPLNSL